MSVPPPRYQRPPVIERLVFVRANMDQEIYDKGFDEWREWVLKEFPVDEPVKNWLINVQERHGVPTDISPELQILPRFSEKTSVDGFGWSIRCPVGQLIMNMHSSHQESRTYEDLRTRFPGWLTRWVQHFQVREFTDLTVHYVNLLDRTTLAPFAHEGFLDIAKVLKIFFRIPGGKELLTPPLDCQVTIKLEGEIEGTLSIRACHRAGGNGPALTLNLVASTALRKDQSVDEILSLMDWCHSRIVERFEVIFTTEAKESFDPYVNS
jgi:hypothetical protein